MFLNMLALKKTKLIPLVFCFLFCSSLSFAWDRHDLITKYALSYEMGDADGGADQMLALGLRQRVKSEELSDFILTEKDGLPGVFSDYYDEMERLSRAGYVSKRVKRMVFDPMVA
ncbi:MAG: hypothetical protein V2B19_02855, partial [Pseudomonadota bacterium]